MHSKTFLAIILIMLALTFVTACERGEKGEHDRNEDERAAAPTATATSTHQATLPAGKATTYNFDGQSPGDLPSNFTSARTGEGDMGSWAILSENTALSKPNVLAQTSTDSTDYRFPVAVLNDGVFKDLELSVKFKTVTGSVDEAGGLVFRYKDEKNYYVVRANALENNYRLYHVVNGRRQQFAGANITVTPKQWHELKVVCVGDQITCFFDGKQVIQATDDTFKDAGRVGMWTKADSVTYFDDFTVTPR
ncbi:MAG TPA: family 16 glycoside hydrolase [Pyrinomonadaceae bacterium]